MEIKNLYIVFIVLLLVLIGSYAQNEFLEKKSGESFDVSVNIPLDYKKVPLGEDLTAEITLYRFGGPGRTDVIVSYFVEYDDKRIPLKSETLLVETSMSYIRTFDLPYYLKPGTYNLYVETQYNKNIINKASANFEIIKAQEYINVPGNLFIMIIGAFLIILIMFISFLIFHYMSIKKMSATLGRIGKKDLTNYIRR